ncbi:MAG: hypothetical protein AB7E47_02385 [Desulfovibrionaceae bacterium]
MPIFKAKKDTTHGNKLYFKGQTQFFPESDAPHLENWTNMGAGEADASAAPEDPNWLVGADSLPAEVTLIPGGTSVQAVFVVQSAHERAGLTVEEWNGLPEEEIARHCDQEVERLRKNAALERLRQLQWPDIPHHNSGLDKILDALARAEETAKADANAKE